MEGFSATDPSTSFTPSQTIIKASIAIFEQQLQDEWECQRMPKGLMDAFAKTSTLEAAATERIFLDYGGRAAWLALYRATRAQGKQNTTIASFHEVSPEIRKNAARGLAGLKQHPSVADIIRKISQKRRHRSLKEQQNPTSNRRRRRPSKAQQNSPTLSATSVTPNKTQNGSIASASFTRLPLEETQSIPTTMPAPLSNAARPSKLEHASQQGMKDVFNERICDAIKGDTIQHNGTTYLKAAVEMAFPIWVMDDCIMTLAIHESKVEDLAKALFNVQVELRGQIRSLILPGGVKVAPSPEITVKGVACSALLDVFGPEIYEAAMASNMREEEVADGVDVLQCVSMILPASSRDTVVINLTLETLRAIQISNKIFP